MGVEKRFHNHPRVGVRQDLDTPYLQTSTEDPHESTYHGVVFDEPQSKPGDLVSIRQGLGHILLALGDELRL